MEEDGGRGEQRGRSSWGAPGSASPSSMTNPIRRGTCNRPLARNPLKIATGSKPIRSSSRVRPWRRVSPPGHWSFARPMSHRFLSSPAGGARRYMRRKSSCPPWPCGGQAGQGEARTFASHSASVLILILILFPPPPSCRRPRQMRGSEVPLAPDWGSRPARKRMATRTAVRSRCDEGCSDPIPTLLSLSSLSLSLSLSLLRVLPHLLRRPPPRELAGRWRQGAGRVRAMAGPPQAPVNRQALREARRAQPSTPGGPSTSGGRFLFKMELSPETSTPGPVPSPGHLPGGDWHSEPRQCVLVLWYAGRGPHHL